MKKIIAIMMSMAFAVSMAACSDNTVNNGDAAKGTTVTKADSAPSTEFQNVKGSVTVSGSSALLPLAQAAADLFMEINPDCSLTVNGGGSGTGLKQVADGSVDIGNSDVFAEEKLDVEAAKALTDHKVCTVTIAPVVNKELGIDNLTKQQLIDIFTAKVTNWNEVGGPDEEILLVTRPSSSGTRALFKKWALDGQEEASNSSLETDDSGTLLETVQNNKGAIGYVALSYIINNDNVSALSIDGISATLENTYNGKYTVWGYEHMYTKGNANEAADKFIGFIMSDEFTSQIEELGYGASSKLSDAAVATHNK